MQENISQRTKLESMTKMTLEKKETNHEIENSQKPDAINQDPNFTVESSSKYRQRRPDKALYVPKALRSQRTVHRNDIQEKSNINMKTKNLLPKSITINDTSFKSDMCCNSSSQEVANYLETNLKHENDENLVTVKDDKIFTKILCNKIGIPNSHDINSSPIVSLNFENSVTECVKSISLSDDVNMKLSTNIISKTLELDIERNPCTDKRESEKVENPSFNIDIPSSSTVINSQSDLFYLSESEILSKTAYQNSESNPNIDHQNVEIEESSKKEFCINLLENDILALISSQSILIPDNEGAIFSYNAESELGQPLNSDVSKRTNEKDLLENIFTTKVENTTTEKSIHSAKDDEWEALFTEDGECLNPEFQKVQAEFGDLQLCETKQDHSEYQTSNNAGSDEWSHIVELYDFPVEFKTQDLVSAFSVFQKDSYTIKWVDDCHALGIFSTPFIATEALDLKHPFIKIRPLSQGTKESKYKAKICEYYNKPYKPRPATSATAARRLVSGALGLRVNMSKEQRENERRVLIEAKERKRQRAKQRQDIWDGVIS